MDKIIERLMKEAAELSNQKRKSEAIFSLERVVIETLNMLGILYYDMAEPYTCKQALKYLKMAEILDGGHWMIHNNMCHVFNTTDQYEYAKEAGIKAVEWVGNAASDPYYNLAVVLANLKETNRSIEMYRKALAIDDRSNYHFNLACELLRTKQWEEGWKEYEFRNDAYAHLQHIRKRFNCPNWDGKKVKRLCVYSEQGIGDFLMFCRFLPQVRELCDELFIEVQAEIEPTIRRIYGGMFDKPGVTISPRTTTGSYSMWPPAPEVDAVLSINSLPGMIHPDPTTLKPEVYVTAADRKIPDGLINDSKFKIGIAWCGNIAHSNDTWRSFHLANYRAISQMPGVQLYSFQKGPNVLRHRSDMTIDFMAGSEGLPYIDLDPYLNDYDDTTAFVDKMDMMITVDSSVAHVAAAMGKETWVMIPYVEDWRWFPEGNTTPWYSTMRLFRQESRGDWLLPFGRVSEELAKVLNQKD